MKPAHRPLIAIYCLAALGVLWLWLASPSTPDIEFTCGAEPPYNLASC